MSIDPAAAAAFRVPRSTVDGFYIPGEQLAESRVGSGVIISVDSSNTCTVLINDEIITGVLWLGKIPPRVGDVVEVEMRGELLVIPGSNDLDYFMEGAEDDAVSIVSDTDPGRPPARDVQLGGSMRSIDAWAFWGADTANWTRELSASGQGMRCFQPALPVFKARNLATIPSAKGGLGPNDAGRSWNGADWGASYNNLTLVTTTAAPDGALAFKADWGGVYPNPGLAGLKVGGHTIGQQYTARLLVYVPTGSPDVRFLAGPGAQSTTAKNAWTKLEVTYIATALEHVLGVATGPGPTSAGVAYFDQLEIVATVTPTTTYFDGATVDTTTDQYLWRGTPFLSSSEHYAGPTTPAVKIATNLLTQPSFEIPRTDPPWGADNATLTMSTTEKYAGAQSLHLVNYLTIPYAGIILRDTATIKIGVDYWISAWVKCANTSLTVGFVPYGDLARQSPFVPVTGSWQRILYGFRAGSEGEQIAIRFRSPATTVAVGAIDAYIDAVMLTADGALAYLDGSLAAGQESYYRWEGTPNDSTSTWWTASPTALPAPTGTLWSEESFEVAPGDLVAVEGHMVELPAVATVSTVLNTNLITNPSMESGTTVPTGIAFTGNGDGVRSTAWKENGAASLELYGKAGGTTDSWAYVQGNNFTAGGAGNVLRPGKSYYLAATLRLAAPLTGTLGGLALRLHVWHNNGVTATNVYSTPAPNVAGVYRLEMWATIPADAVWAVFRLGHGASAGNGSSFWDSVLVMEAPAGTQCPYFDGSTPSSPETGFYEWSGTAHASQSTRRTAPSSSVSTPPTGQVVVLYGPSEGINWLPTDLDTVVAAYGSPVTIGTTDTTVATTVTVPDTVAFPSTGTAKPQMAKLGFRLIGDGDSQVLVTSAAAKHTPKAWPLGSTWRNPDAQEGGLPTWGVAPAPPSVPSGSYVSMPVGTVNQAYPLPSVKKVVFTAPPGTGGVLEVVLTLSVNIPVGAGTTAHFEAAWGTAPNTGFFGTVPRVLSATENMLFPVISRGLIQVAAGETVEVIPQYRYASANPATAWFHIRPMVQAVFTPGAVLLGSAALPAADSYWDGDSWRPPRMEPAVIDLTKDAAVAPPSKTTTTTTLARSASTLHAGANLTLTATVTAGAAGSVTFFRSASASGPWTSLGTGVLSATKAVKVWTATAGTHYFKATYTGSPTYASSSSAATTATTVQQLVAKTVNLACSWVQPYRESGAKLTGSGYDAAAHQGYDPAYGNRKSLLRFDHSAIPAAAAITDAVLVCRTGGWVQWYSGTTGTLVVGSFTNNATAPTTWPAADVVDDQSRHAVPQGGFSVNISAWAKGPLEAAAFSGLVLGPGPSNATSYFGYSAAAGKDQFTLKVTYQNWE
jgi:hypothetical protein